MFTNLINDKMNQKISYMFAIGILSLVSFLSISVVVQSQDTENIVAAVCSLDDIHIQDMSSTVTGGTNGIENESAIGNPDMIKTPSLDTSLVGISGSRHVAVIIIDDFTTVIAGTNKTHGYFVKDVVESILPAQVPIITLDYAPDATLLNTYNLLQAEINKQEYDFYVVNMSWVILPCKENLEVMINENLFIVPLDLLLYRTIAQLTLPEFEVVYEDIYVEIEELLLSIDNGVNPDDVMNHILASFEITEQDATFASELGVELEVRSHMNLIEFMMVLGGVELIPDNFLAVQRVFGLAMYTAGNSTNAEVTDFKNLLSRGYIFPIAASGNFNLVDFAEVNIDVIIDDDGNGTHDAFAPASWPEVLAVSGQVASDGSLWQSSHDGQVSAVASWVQFGTTQVGEGTSFAAPQVTGHVAWVARRCDVHQLLNLEKFDNEDYISAIDTLINCDGTASDLGD